jgi:hypothetical protein
MVLQHEIESTPKHRSSGNVVIPKLQLQTPRSSDAAQKTSSTQKAMLQLRAGVAKMQKLLHQKSMAAGACAAVLAIMLGILLFRSTPGAAKPEDASTESGFAMLDKLYEEKLKSIATSVTSLENLGQIVVKADETYEEVYHNKLVQHVKDAPDASEVDWNGFVQEARLTGPVFLAGKEQLREAVANMQRVIRRAPEYLRSMAQWLSKHNADEASWYLGKVVKLVDSVHKSMENAAVQFAQAETTIGGMARDAKENVEHFENKAFNLEGEVKAIEGTSASTGSWERSLDKALSGCYLEKLRSSLAECKLKCINHTSGSCSQLTYYKTASRNNCYLHCESATSGSYREADIHLLQRAPAQLAQDVTLKTQAAQVAVGLKSRWQTVQSPLREVTRLVRRFRAATADLRGSLEDARFAMDDLLAAFNASAPSPDGFTDKHFRLLGRRVEDVVAAIEDLGDSLAILRFQ